MKDSSDSILAMIKGFSKSMQIEKALSYVELLPDKTITISYHLNLLIESLIKTSKLEEA